MNIVPFTYEQDEVRVLTDENGDPWWVVTDLCTILGHSDPHKAIEGLDDDEKGRRKVPTLGGIQELSVVTESGLFTLILRSNKPKAKPFRKWVTSEVLPTIRKTGSYSVGKPPQKLSEPFADMVQLAEIFGFKGNQAKLYANKGFKNYYGVDPMALMELTGFVSEDKSVDLNPTEIGALIGLTNREVNKRLVDIGYQQTYKSGKINKYMPTEKGKPYAVLKDVNKQHTNGTPITQLRWLQDVAEHIKET